MNKIFSNFSVVFIHSSRCSQWSSCYFFKKLFLQFSYPFMVDSELPLFFSYLVRVYEFYRIQTINKTTFLVSSNVSADI